MCYIRVIWRSKQWMLSLQNSTLVFTGNLQLNFICPQRAIGLKAKQYIINNTIHEQNNDIRGGGAQASPPCWCDEDTCVCYIKVIKPLYCLILFDKSSDDPGKEWRYTRVRNEEPEFLRHSHKHMLHLMVLWAFRLVPLSWAVFWYA